MTAAEGTDEVGVLDFVPVVLGVAAAEDCPDSDISSWGHYGTALFVEGEEERKNIYMDQFISPFTGLVDEALHDDIGFVHTLAATMNRQLGASVGSLKSQAQIPAES